MEILKHDAIVTVSIIIMLLTCAAYPAMCRTLDGYEASVVATTRHREWMEQYGRSYDSEAEKEKRFGIFMENLEYIEKFNSAGNKSYKLGLNQFADLTKQEFIASHTGLMMMNSSKTASSYKAINLYDVPASMDWRDKGAVTPVKNQGKCECCWAFTTAAAVEGIVQIKTGTLTSLSEQQLVDCTSSNQGCSGGNLRNAFQYVVDNRGLATESDYPYAEKQQQCSKSSPTPQSSIISYQEVPPNDESQLLQIVALQPVSIAISATGDFQLYKEGVFTGPCDTTLNHGVTVIGYGVSRDGIKYWLVKNSWGPGWGEAGYMRIQRDSGQPQGLCGLAMGAAYPSL